MGIDVVEIHHPGLRVDADKLAAVQQFYTGILGLPRDEGRPSLPGVPGFWINVGEVGQLHLIGGDLPSPFAKSPEQDPTLPHVALAVADVAAAKAELDRMQVPYWSLKGATGPDAEQLFLKDPCGNMIELHQVDKCRCRVKNRMR